MKTFIYLLAALLIVVAVVFMMGTDVELEDSGALPDVDVSAEGGRMPEVDVQTPEVNVNSSSTTVEVPDVDVEMEEREVKIPSVDIDAAEDSMIDDASEPEAAE